MLVMDSFAVGTDASRIHRAMRASQIMCLPRRKVAQHDYAAAWIRVIIIRPIWTSCMGYGAQPPAAPVAASVSAGPAGRAAADCHATPPAKSHQVVGATGCFGGVLALPAHQRR